MITGTLYVISTPIGNLDDISIRATKILGICNIIAAEDTRTTKKLLKKYNILTKLISYNDYNEANRSKQLINMLHDGNSVALVSDAGTPCISDPGYRVVKLAHENLIPIRTIPGPCSVTAALSVSGLPSNRFFFEGFLPKKKGRQKRIKFLMNLDETIILFESPYRVYKTLSDIYDHFGDRYVSICKELTKIYEDSNYGKLSKFLDSYKDKKFKGEYVILISKKGLIK